MYKQFCWAKIPELYLNSKFKYLNSGSSFASYGSNLKQWRNFSESLTEKKKQYVRNLWVILNVDEEKVRERILLVYDSIHENFNTLNNIVFIVISLNEIENWKGRKSSILAIRPKFKICVEN